MAVATTDSNLIATLEAHGVNPVSKSGGRVRAVQDSIELVAEQIQDNGDVIRMFRIPSNSILTSILLAFDLAQYESSSSAGSSSSGAGLAGLGFYYPDGTLIDEDILADEIPVFGDDGAFTEYLHENQNIDKCGKYAWEMAGLSEDPGGHLDVCVTILGNADSFYSGTFSFKARYVID